jgi:hypothetical protein
MTDLWSILYLVHIIGLILAVGAATVKIILLIKSNSNPDFLPVYINAAKPVTSLIVLGMILLTISGIIWLLDGYPLSSELIIKLILVASVWVLGPIIDNAVEPRFLKLAPVSLPASSEFILVKKKFLALEITATSIFYVIIVYWVLK